MKTNTIISFLLILVTTAIGTPGATAKKKTPAVPLTAAGEKLEAQYAGQLETLRTDIAKAVPKVNAQRKSAFLKAREAEVAAAAGRSSSTPSRPRPPASTSSPHAW